VVKTEYGKLAGMNIDGRRPLVPGFGWLCRKGVSRGKAPTFTWRDRGTGEGKARETGHEAGKGSQET